MYVPTKGRPDNAIRLQEQFYKSTVLASRIVFILSDNDAKINDYHSLDCTITVSPQKPGFVDPLNLGYLQDRKKVYSYALGFMGDDHMPRTYGWDEKFVGKLLEMRAGLVYGNDLLQGEKIPTHIAMTADIPLSLGFMTLPQLSHLYADDFWLDFGKELGRLAYMPEVVIEHMHPAAGKSQQDAGYDFSGSHNLDASDKRIYHDYLNDDFDGDIRRVRNTLRRLHEA